MLKEHLIIKNILSLPNSFFNPESIFFTFSTKMSSKQTMDHALYYTIGKVAMEKLSSILSKMQDDTATPEDRLLAVLLQEISALSKNRLSVAANETEFSNDSSVWVERTAQTHFPHIRLHGGALEDDPIKSWTD